MQPGAVVTMDRQMPEDRDRLTAHATECEDCRQEPLPLDRVGTVLDAVAVNIDAPALSQQALRRARPELERLALVCAWRRALVGVLLALLPLPAVLAYDAYVLRIVYGVASALLPAAFAAYLVLSYAALLVLLFATTYAAIPLLVVRGRQSPAAGTYA